MLKLWTALDLLKVNKTFNCSFSQMLVDLLVCDCVQCLYHLNTIAWCHESLTAADTIHAQAESTKAALTKTMKDC